MIRRGCRLGVATLLKIQSFRKVHFTHNLLRKRFDSFNLCNDALRIPQCSVSSRRVLPAASALRKRIVNLELHF
jgi:hypothetical protein